MCYSNLDKDHYTILSLPYKHDTLNVISNEFANYRLTKWTNVEITMKKYPINSFV